MPPPVFPRAALRTQLTALGATSGYLNGCKVHLFKSNTTPTDASVLGDFTECDFTGYAAGAAVTWNNAYSDVAGNAIMVGTLNQFEATGSTTANTVYGAYLTDSAGTTLLMAVRFAAPIQISQAGDAVIYVPEVSQAQPPE